MYRIFIALLFINFCYSQSYYVYVAAESDDTVSVLKFDGDNFEETDKIRLLWVLCQLKMKDLMELL